MLLIESLTQGDFSDSGAKRAVFSKDKDLGQERGFSQCKQLFLVTKERKPAKETGCKVGSQ